ncbi:hypothetical protein ACFVGM_13770 [Kitasatospora purpeofusca]
MREKLGHWADEWAETTNDLLVTAVMEVRRLLEELEKKFPDKE